MAEAVYLEMQPTPESLKRLNQMVFRLMSDTGRGTVDALGYAGVKVCVSGAKAAAPGAKKRKMIPNPKYKEASRAYRWAASRRKKGLPIPQAAADALEEIKRDESWAPYLIVRLTQGEPIMWPSYDKKDARLTIDPFTPGKLGGRGLARKTWEIMGAKLASLKGSDRFYVRDSRYRLRAYRERYGENKGANIMRLINSLSYMDKAYPGIATTAIELGTRALGHEMDAMAKRACQKANAA